MPNFISFLPCLFSAAAVDGWRKFLEKEGQYVSKEGLPYHQQLTGAVEILGKALIEDKDADTIKLLKMSNALGIQLLPHVQNEKFRRIHSEIIDGINKLSNDAESNKLGSDDVHNFIRKAYKSMSTL